LSGAGRKPKRKRRKAGESINCKQHAKGATGRCRPRKLAKKAKRNLHTKETDQKKDHRADE